MSKVLYISLFSLAFVVVVVGFVFFAFLKQARHYEFQSYGGVRHRAKNVFVKKHILILRFLAHSKVKVCKCLFAQYR